MKLSKNDIEQFYSKETITTENIESSSHRLFLYTNQLTHILYIYITLNNTNKKSEHKTRNLRI